MDVLDKLQAGLDELMACLENLKEEKSRLQHEVSILKDENRLLRMALERERLLRGQVLDRIDGLLAKVREHDNVG